jgi:carboxyl-terminal processing protease
VVGVGNCFVHTIDCGTIPGVNSTTRTLINTIFIVVLTIGAFGTGYLARGWQIGLSSILAPGESTQQSEPVTQHELYQQVWNLLERDYYGEDPPFQDRLYGSVRGLAQAYNDPYTYFLEPQPRQLERDQLLGRFGGIGAYIDPTEDGYILRPMPGYPAAEAGAEAGDHLVSVDDTPITKESELDRVLTLVRGPVGSEVCLGIERQGPGGGAPQTLRLCMVRIEIETPSIEYRLLDDDPLTASIGYIRHTIFSERSATEMATAVEELQLAGADRFILDLRGNPGGLVDAAIAVADLWLDEGIVFYERQANGQEREFTSSADDASRGDPLVVLVDYGSASASEIVAGALRDRGRAILVGEQTFGKGSVQLVHELIDKSSLHVTTARWYTPKWQAIDGIGLTPDIVLDPGYDPLVRAVEAVQEMAGAHAGVTAP